MGVLVWHIPPPVHLLTPLPCQHVWDKQPDNVPQAANFPLLKAKCTRSIFHWSLSLSPALAWKTAHAEALTKFTQQAFRGNRQNLSLPNAEMSNGRAVLQRKMALDIITASQGGTCTVIQTECCVLISDESVDVPSLLNHTRTQVSVLRDPIPNLGDFINQWFRSRGSSWKKKLFQR